MRCTFATGTVQSLNSYSLEKPSFLYSVRDLEWGTYCCYPVRASHSECILTQANTKSQTSRTGWETWSWLDEYSLASLVLLQCLSFACKFKQLTAGETSLLILIPSESATCRYRESQDLLISMRSDITKFA